MPKPTDTPEPVDDVPPTKSARRLSQLRDPQIRHLQPNDSRKPTWFGRGFGARANSDGTKTFLFSFRSPVTGKKRWHSLGNYPDMSLAKALDEHDRCIALVKRGKDPVVEAENAKAAESAALAATLVPPLATVRDVFDHWKRTALKCIRDKSGLKVSGYKDDGAHLELKFKTHVFPRWGTMPIRDVRRAMVLDLLDATKAKGKLSTAGHLFTDLYSFFKFAVLREYIDRNPLEGVDKRKEVGRANKGKRFLLDWEIARLQQRLPVVNLHEVTQLALRFVLATGARADEVAAMPKGELDERAALWVVPPTRYKTGHQTRTAHTVPLSPHALRILEAAKAFNAGSTFVFPSPVDDERHVDRHSLSKAIARKLGKATPADKDPAAGSLGLARFTTHDLRRTVQTGLARIGVAEDIANRVTGHTSAAGAMAALYNKHDYLEERRAALDAWGRHLDALAKSSAHVGRS